MLSTLVMAQWSDGRLPEGTIRGRKHQRLYAEGRYRAYIITSPREACISERYNRSIKSMMESSDLCHHVAVILENNWDKLRFHLADATRRAVEVWSELISEFPWVAKRPLSYLILVFVRS